MTLSKRALAVVAGAGLLLGGLSTPVSAHPVTLTQMHIADFGQGGINTQMWLSKEDHPGTVMITLKKKAADGSWKAVATKKATYSPGWGYMKTFDPVKGKTKCKARGVFTAKNHAKVVGTSDVIPC